MARRSSSPHDYEAFEVGDQVRHPKWGVGSILFKSGTGDSTKAIVVFPEQGQKKLLLKYAGLERVQETIESDEDEFGAKEEVVVPAKAPSKRASTAEDDEEEEEVIDVADLGTDAAWEAEEEEEAEPEAEDTEEDRY